MNRQNSTKKKNIKNERRNNYNYCVILYSSYYYWNSYGNYACNKKAIKRPRALPIYGRNV